MLAGWGFNPVDNRNRLQLSTRCIVSILDETRYIERVQFFNGQRLFPPDLQAIDDFNRGMRWLHNLSLHQPGIGSGFAVYGKKGDRKVTIKAGYALDDLGREIVLTHPEPLPV